MTEPRALTAEAIVAERSDMQPDGERYIELSMTGAIVAGTTPHARRAVASFIRALLMLEPTLSAPAYEAHLAILGALYRELETAAIAGAIDEPEPTLADLRDPGVLARERDLIRETKNWAEAERSRRTEAYRAHVDELLAESEPAHVEAQAKLDAAVASAQVVIAGLVPELDDASAWLA